MKFDFDIANVVKIVVRKNENHLIEYTIDNGTIVDASIVKNEKTVEEKIENLKSTPTVQKIKEIISLDKKINEAAKDSRQMIAKNIFEEEKANNFLNEIANNG